MRMNYGAALRRAAVTAAFVLACSMVSFADDASQFVPGTTVNGIGVGGMTVEEAKTRIEGFYESNYKLTVGEKNGKSEILEGEDIGYRVTVPEGLASILEEQNAGGRQSGPSVDNSHSMQLAAVYDDAALAARIQALGCISGSGITVTSDAYITPYQEGQPFSIVPEVMGNNVDPERTAAVIRDAVETGKTAVNLEESGCYYTVKITAEDPQLKALCDTMNQCREMVISYQFGGVTEELTGAVICTWLKGSADNQIGVDRDAVTVYVRALADKYDTAGKSRVFHTATGKEVELTGPYGWKLDQEAEIEALVGMIRTGQTQVRDPQYTLQAVSRTAPDWGSTYVEVDLAGQHAYMFKDGALVWDAPCVTGNVSKGHTTPAGIYSLNYKQTDRILRGEKRADGSYEYESHVDYWMPFNGGIGLHDANWRSKFGGTIYQYGGSHGCINLPPSKAKELYGMIYKGIPVICHN